MTLRELLESCLLNQVEFAEKLGVTKATVSRWVSGERRPTMAHIRAMIDILGLPKEQVLAAVKETAARYDTNASAEG